jgi:hypothetical protein
LKENIEKTTKNINIFQAVGMDQMEQKSVILFLRLKRLSKKVIRHKFVAMLQKNAFSYSSVTIFCREAILGLNSEDASLAIIAQRDGLDEVNEAILLALSDGPFSSVGQIARRICVPKGTVYHWLVDSLHFTVKPHTSSLGSSQALRQSKGKPSRIESSRVELSIQLRDLLLSIWHQG